MDYSTAAVSSRPISPQQVFYSQVGSYGVVWELRIGNTVALLGDRIALTPGAMITHEDPPDHPRTAAIPRR